MIKTNKFANDTSFLFGNFREISTETKEKLLLASSESKVFKQMDASEIPSQASTSIFKASIVTRKKKLKQFIVLQKVQNIKLRKIKMG